MSSFRFKQFSINQDKTAMKVGTDGVLLGAWSSVDNPKNILDIGTGTGLIALMMAQRSTAIITAIEIEPNAFIQASDNIQNSNWHERITVVNSAIQDFKSDKKFDLVISNPPFFQNSLKNSDKAKSTARHTDSLTFNDLIQNSSKFLSDKGIAAFIIPFESEEYFLKVAAKEFLFPKRICYVKGNENSKIKRSLIELSFDRNRKVKFENLTIEKSRHIYTEKYIDLTKEFYINM
jgi:tRNA1Val (adenine37-N6)-methyltransferase